MVSQGSAIRSALPLLSLSFLARFSERWPGPQDWAQADPGHLDHCWVGEGVLSVFGSGWAGLGESLEKASSFSLLTVRAEEGLPEKTSVFGVSLSGQRRVKMQGPGPLPRQEPRTVSVATYSCESARWWV